MRSKIWIVFGILMQPICAGNAFDVFKKNQWAVNKKFKTTDGMMKNRIDGMQATMLQQTQLIATLIERLKVLEAKQELSHKDSRFSVLDKKVQLLENRSCICLNDNEHADFNPNKDEIIKNIKLPPAAATEMNTAPKPNAKLPVITPIFPSKTDLHTIEVSNSNTVAKQVPPAKPVSAKVGAPKIGASKVGPPNSVSFSAPKPVKLTLPKPTPKPTVEKTDSFAYDDEIILDDTLLTGVGNTDSLFSALLGKLKQYNTNDKSVPKTTPAPRLPVFQENEPCVAVPKKPETSGAFVHTSWVNGGTEAISFNAFAYLPVPMLTPEDGKLIIKFNAPASEIEVWEAVATPFTEDGTQWVFAPTDQNVYMQNAGGTWKFNFIATVASLTADMSMEFCRNLIVPSVTLSYPAITSPDMQYDMQYDLPIDIYSEMETAESVKSEYEDDAITLDYDLLNGLGVSLDSLGLSGSLASAPAPPSGNHVKPSDFFPRNLPTAPKRPPSKRCAGPSGKAVKMPRQSFVNFTRAPDEELEIFGYDLNEVLHKSILFYEAQRAGELPRSNRVLWRGDSVLRDGCDIGVDLSRGWFDAGDHVKFTFPAAFTTTMLVWSIIDYPDAYEASGELNNALDQVKWGLDWLLKAQISPTELVVMVGDPHADHGIWGRPEDIHMRRPTYVVNEQNPGTEPAAEAAAALAAGSILFATRDPKYSEKLLTSSKQLLEFADRNRKSYHLSVPEVADFYKSWSGYEDELCWATAWIYKATNNTSYGRLAKYYYNSFDCGKNEESFDWDKKHAGVQLLMSQITGDDQYRSDVEKYANFLVDVEKKTAEGMIWFHKWGSLRIANNWGAFLLGASRLEPKLPRAGEYAMLAINQIGYALGDKGRSYVQGFGKNAPLRSHHRAASCPKAPSSCSNMLNSGQPNHWILYGALVGGPNFYDQYEDVRSDYVMNEVAIDYNAGFQYSVAALKSILLKRN